MRHLRLTKHQTFAPTARTSGLRTGLLTVLLALVVSLVPSPGDAAAMPAGGALVAVAAVPPTPSGLPDQLEDLARYVPATSCDPDAKPGTTALGRLLTASYPGRRYGIDRSCGSASTASSEHYEGRAVDFFLHVRKPAQRAEATALLRWLFAVRDGERHANARRLGVMYVIWNNQMWGSYRAGDGWRPYAGCASRPGRAYDTTCHRDHIHLSLSWEGAMRRTSWWSGRVAAPDYGPCRPADLNWARAYVRPRTTPCPRFPRVSAPAGSSALYRVLVTHSGKVLRRGDSGPAVRAVQQTVRATADGMFGTQTKAAVVRWQRRHGLGQTGVVTANTWRSLLRARAPRG